MRGMRGINNKKEKKSNENELTQEEINELNDIELEKISKNVWVDNLYNFLIHISSFCLKTILFLFKASSIYLLWICLHYFSAHLYVKFCVPDTMVGFFMSPFVIMTPHCQGLRWIVYNAANIINNMWLLIGAWIYSVIWFIGKEQTCDGL
jgi:hypothetical protein